MAIFVNDTFTDTEGTAITSHTPEVGGAITLVPDAWPAGGAEIASNRVRDNNGLIGLFKYAATPGDEEYDVEAVVRCVTATGEVAICGRIDSGGFCYLLRINVSGEVRLYYFNGGFTNIGDINYSWSPSINTDYTFKLEIRNATKKVFLGGVEIITSNDNTISSAGQAGFFFNGAATDSTGFHIASLVATDIISDTLTSGRATFEGADDTTISLEVEDATTGTEPYTYQWYASQTSGFTPGGGNILSGETAQTLDFDDAAPGEIWHFVCRVTDDDSNEDDSNQVTATLWEPPISVLFIGDSTTQDTNFDSVDKTGVRLSCIGGPRRVTALNHGEGGSLIFAPASEEYDDAVAAAAAATPPATYAMVMFGANHAGDLVADTDTEFETQLSDLCDALILDGITPILNYPMGINPGLSANHGTAAIALLESYLPKIDGLCNGTTILQGDTQAYKRFAAEADTLLGVDGVHQNEAGSEVLSTLWADAFERAVNPAAVEAVGEPGNLSGGIFQ